MKKSIILLNEVNEAQTQELSNLIEKVDQLTTLVEQLIAQQSENPGSNSYILQLKHNAQLSQNQPNPFQEDTKIDFFIPKNTQSAYLQITSLNGQVLGKIKITETGKGNVIIKANSFPAGMYFYFLVLDGQTFDTKKMILR